MQDPKTDLRKFYAPVDTKQLSIENVTLEQLKDNSLTLRFDLKNLNEDKPLRGKADVSLLTDNARLIEHSLNGENQIFQIKHYKTFDSTIHLPQGLSGSDIFALRISISGPQGKEYFGLAYRLDDLIS